MKIDYLFDWPELVAFTFLLVGFFLALFSQSFFVLYSVCFLMGLIFGRVWWKWKTANKVPVFLTIVGFLLGFMLGSLFANLRLIVLLVFGGIIIGYYVHVKKFLKM